MKIVVELSADAGNIDAKFELGKRLVDYDSEFIVDFEKGHELLLEVAESGNSEAMYELYRYYSYHENDKEKGIFWAEQAVDSGTNTFLRRELAEWFFNEGEIKDIDKAIKYYEALFNDKEDIFRTHSFLPLAICYLKKEKSDCDYGRVKKLLEQAKQCTESDDYYYKGKLGEIFFWMGYMAERGLGFQKDLELAFNLYTQSASQGFEPAQKEIPLFKKTIFGWKKL